MSYQRDSRGDSFASRRANYKLYVTTIVRQNGRRHRRERPLVWRWKINFRWINTTFFSFRNIKICHLIIVDNPSEGGSIKASKSVKIRNHVRKQERQRWCLDVPIPGLQPRQKAAMLGDQYNRIFPRRIYMKMEFSSQKREMPLFSTSNMAAVTSRANQLWHMIISIVIVSLIRKVFCSVFCSCPSLKGTRTK